MSVWSWLRLTVRALGWPPARLYRAGAWSLTVTVAWLVGLQVSTPGWLAASAPDRSWVRGWDQLVPADLARVFLQLAPVALPAGLALAGLVWAWGEVQERAQPAGGG